MVLPRWNISPKICRRVVNNPLMSKQQIPIAFRLDAESSFENFYCDAARVLVVDALRRQAEGVGEKFLFLHALDGRSHLLQASASYAERCGRSVCYLPLQEVKGFPPEAVLEGLESIDLICLDDIDQIVGVSAWERGIFNLYNRLLCTSGCLLVSSRKAIMQLPVGLADLHSRLQSFSVFQLPVLDDAARMKAFQFRASLRGIVVPDGLAEYVMARCQRDFGSLVAVLDRLDNTSLAEKRKLTIPFVKDVMGW